MVGINRLRFGRTRYIFREMGGMDLVRNAGQDPFTFSEQQRKIRNSTAEYFREIGYSQRSTRESDSKFRQDLLSVFDMVESTERSFNRPWNIGTRSETSISRDMRWIGATAALVLARQLPREGQFHGPYIYNYGVVENDALFLARDCITEGILRGNKHEGIQQEEASARTEALMLAREIFNTRDYISQRDMLENFVNRGKSVRRNPFSIPSRD